MSISDVNAYFKQRYSQEAIDLIPVNDYLYNLFPLQKQKMIGESYVQPVKVANSQGATYSAPNTGSFTLNEPGSLTGQQAKATGYQLYMATDLSFEEMARAKDNVTAFGSILDYKVSDLKTEMMKRVMIDMLYGQSSTGIGVPTTATNVSPTSTTLNYLASSWAPRIWVGRKNCILNFYDSGVIIGATSADQVFTIVSVNNSTKSIIVSGTTSGIAALEAAIAAPGDNVVTYFNGSFNNQMSGMDKIMTNTGLLFNIDAAVYDMWKSNVYNNGGAPYVITQDHVQKSIIDAYDRGLDENDVTVLLNPKTWNKLQSDVVSNRRYDSSYSPKAAETGVETVKYYGVNGVAELKAYGFVKEGDVFIFSKNDFTRVGAQEISFDVPGKPNEEIFIPLIGPGGRKAGVELGAYSNQALMPLRPASMVKMTGFTLA